MFRLQNSVAGKIGVAVVLSGALLLGACGKGGRPLAADEVRMNGVTMSKAQLDDFGNTYGAQLRPGNYWYDRESGLWGNAGQGAAGMLPPGLGFPGTLAADASGGDSGTFINGRELTGAEAAAFERMNQGPIGKNRWWVDGLGNIGLEGGGPLGNIAALVQGGMGGGGGGGGNDHRSVFRPGELSGAEVVGGGVYMGHGQVYTPN